MHFPERGKKTKLFRHELKYKLSGNFPHLTDIVSLAEIGIATQVEQGHVEKLQWRKKILYKKFNLCEMMFQFYNFI